MIDPEKMLADDPGSVVFSRYAEKLAREGQIGQAVDVLKRGIQANPFHAPGYSVLAELLFQLESEEEAVENIMSALRLDPQMPRDLFLLGTHYLESNPSKALPLLKTASVYEPESEEVAASFERAGLLMKFSGTVEDALSEAGVDSPVEGGASASGAGEKDFGKIMDVPLPGEDFHELSRKPYTPINQEDQDFLAMLGEQSGGTIDEELDSLFQSAESNAGKAAFPEEQTSDELDFEETSAVEAEGGGVVPDLNPIAPEAVGKNLAEQLEEVESPADESPFESLPPNKLDEADLNSDEVVFPDTYTQLIEETEKEKDFSGAISTGDEKAEDDLDTLFESLHKNRNLEGPLSGLEENGLERADRELTGPEPDPGAMPYGGVDEVPGENIPQDYGIVDLEKEADEESILEISDDEEYNLAQFGFDSIPEDDLPVLSEAERTELMALTHSREDDTEESEDGLGLGDLSLEDLDKPDHPDEDDETVQSYTGRDADTIVAHGAPVDGISVDETDMEDLAGEGIGYSDILSSWKLSGEESNPSSPLEPELFSISDILDDMAESSPGNSEVIAPEYRRLADSPVITVMSELEMEDVGEPGISEPESFEGDGFSVSYPQKTTPFLENDDKKAPSGPVERTREFELPLMDGPLDMGNLFHPLSEEQAALIDDFISGKEPDTEPNLPEGLFPVPESVEVDGHSPQQVFLGEDGALATASMHLGFPPEPENALETEAVEFADELEELLHPVTAEGEQSPPASTGIDGAAFYPLTLEPPISPGHAKMVEKAGSEESLDDLISLYQDMLDKPASRVAWKAAPPPAPVPHPSAEPKASLPHERESGSRNVSKPLGSYTATMAEIYVSQGLITRAMEIYIVLTENNPNSEPYRLRLAELKRMHEQQPDAS